MGAPTKLTPEVQDIIVSTVARGNFLQTAARLARIDDATMARWLQKGREGAEPYAGFCEAVARAEAESETAMVACVVGASQMDARQAQWHLERRWAGKRWQQRKELSIDGEVTTKRLILSSEEDDGQIAAPSTPPPEGEEWTGEGAQ